MGIRDEPGVLERLRTDHRRLVRMFKVLEHQMQLLSMNGDGPDFRLLEDVVHYIVEYPDSVHHPLEDRVFARVTEKGVGAELEQLISKNRDQHLEIGAGTKTLQTAIQHVLAGAVIPSDRLISHVTAYVEVQRKHLLVEEERLFPLAVRILEAQDWLMLEAEPTILDPVFEQMETQFADLYRYIVDFDRDSEAGGS